MSYTFWLILTVIFWMWTTIKDEENSDIRIPDPGFEDDEF